MPEPLPTLLVVAVALADAKGRVLLARRPPGKALAGLLEFPGGKIESDDETPEHALIREVQEELGIVVRETDLAPLCFISKPEEGFHLVMLLYLCRVWRGIPQPHASEEVLWATPAEMPGLPMIPADAPLVSALARALAVPHDS